MHREVHYSALMSVDPEALAVEIGHRVKAARTHRGWTLDQLAAAAEVSRRMVVNIEQGATNPSIGTLLRLSESLGVALAELVEPPRTGDVTVTRAGDGTLLWRGEHGGTARLVANTTTPDALELWEWTLEPGDQHESDAHIAGTRELLMVLSGELTIVLDEQSTVLHAGDAITFNGDVSHVYANRGTASATFSMTVFDPERANAGRASVDSSEASLG